MTCVWSPPRPLCPWTFLKCSDAPFCVMAKVLKQDSDGLSLRPRASPQSRQSSCSVKHFSVLLSEHAWFFPCFPSLQGPLCSLRSISNTWPLQQGQDHRTGPFSPLLSGTAPSVWAFTVRFCSNPDSSSVRPGPSHHKALWQSLEGATRRERFLPH